MSYYGEEMKWKRIAAGILILLAVAVIAAKVLQPSSVSVKWDADYVRRGDMAVLWVNVRNTTDSTMDLVVVRVTPISPFLTVYSASDANTPEFYIPKLAPGAEAVAKFGVHVSEDAYQGDHAVRITVAMPGKTYVYEAKIRVV